LIIHLIKVHGYSKKSAKELLSESQYQEQTPTLVENETLEQTELFTGEFTEEEINCSQSISKSLPETIILLLDCETTGNPEPKIM
jgi:hypothetical protein